MTLNVSTKSKKSMPLPFHTLHIGNCFSKVAWISQGSHKVTQTHRPHVGQTPPPSSLTSLRWGNASLHPNFPFFDGQLSCAMLLWPWFISLFLRRRHPTLWALHIRPERNGLFHVCFYLIFIEGLSQARFRRLQISSLAWIPVGV